MNKYLLFLFSQLKFSNTQVLPKVIGLSFVLSEPPQTGALFAGHTLAQELPLAGVEFTIDTMINNATAKRQKKNEIYNYCVYKIEFNCIFSEDSNRLGIFWKVNYIFETNDASVRDIPFSMSF